MGTLVLTILPVMGMEDTFTINTEEVDVEAIMQEIHRRVLEKKRNGVYTDEELQHISELKQDLSPKQNERASELSLELRKLHLNWDVAASSRIITSHRRVLGPLLVFAKKFGFRLLLFIGSAFFTRQTEYNAAGVRLSSLVLEELTRLTAENKQLQRTQQELLHRLELLEAQQQQD
ncbi:hypothetical protein GF339_18455 [candidate division KSB3 bacterium]|uniref:Uncharacterized protein n=1 Tax=candidate division KSB3 bacterium TaxID=2044937 RepID=A0A9D5JZC1_9BACT|nr:hypothetical protein [candidate division KSB3 bacterium]MBD3326572.1 hypothetical protein [candidate division KSB3 bacterium]